MGRRKLSPSERLERKRISQKKYRMNKKATNDLYKISIDLYPETHHLDQSQKDFIRSMILRPVTNDSIQSSRMKAAEAKRQIGIARSKIKSKKNIDSIDFVMKHFDKDDFEYFWAELPDVIEKLLDRINLDDHWIVHYRYQPDASNKEHQKKTLDSITQQYLIDQIKKEFDNSKEVIEYNDEIQSGGPFFPISMKKLIEIHFRNEDELGLRGRANNNKLSRKDFATNDSYEIYCSLIKSGASKKVIDKHVRKTCVRNKLGGKFWRWYNLLPEVNLKRFMIFNKLDRYTAAEVERDNCFIYACRMAGVNENILNDMRYCIHKRSFGVVDIKNISKELGLSFEIKTDNAKLFIGPKREDSIKLILINDHYMVNEKVNVSPYYIRNRNEILSDKSLMHWSAKDLISIVGRNGKYWTKSSKMFSLRKVLNAMFECNYFKPISSNEFMVFNSMICFEKIDSIKSLEYDEMYCCKRKESTIQK